MSAPYSREVLAELVLLHARVLTRMPVIQLVLICGLALAIADEVPSSLFLGWSALTLGIESGRAFYASRLFEADLLFDAYREHRRMVGLALCAGAANGLAAAFFLPVLPFNDQALLGVVLVATPAAGVAVSMSSRYIAGAFSLAVIAPTATAWSIAHPDQSLSVFAMATLLSCLLILVALENERLLLRSVLIRHERDRVVRDLERSNADVREAIERAEAAAQSRARVLAAASHDLRQPLHALSVYSAILAADPEPATLREVGSNIDQIVRSLGNLLHGLLDLSQLAASKYLTERRRFDLARLLTDVCAEYEPMAAAKGLILTNTLTSAVLNGDAMAVSRIARNLIENAIKYTDAGHVRVTLRIEGNFATLSVTDTGRGIAPDDKARVFEEFYQVGNAERDRSQGVGLGLAIVKRLVELIDGAITLNSNLGEGTSFVVCMPGIESVANSTPVSLLQMSDSTELRIGNSIRFEFEARVFVIDDESDIRESMILLLTMWGMEAYAAANESQAKALYERRGSPDLLITDLRLGEDSSGAALAARLHRDHGAVPTIIITGETSTGAFFDAMKSGHVVLQKPVDSALLRSTILTALNP